MSRRLSVRVSVDALPYRSGLHQVCDYSGQQIYGKVALPLFIESRHSRPAKPWGCNDFDVSDDGLQHTFRIREDLAWSTGHRVTAYDYERAFKLICRDHGNRYRTLLSDVANFREFTGGRRDDLGVRAMDKSVLQVTLRNANVFFHHILSHLVLSPMQQPAGGPQMIHCGPYEFESYTERGYRLTVNPFFQLEASAGVVEELEFVNHGPGNSENLSLSAYRAGEVDVTCDTSLTYETYAANRRCADFHTGDSKIVVRLSPGGRFKDIPGSVKHAMSRWIDRVELVERLLGIPKAVHSYQDLYYDQRTDRSFACCEPMIRSPTSPVSISFEDFYPNSTIVDVLRSQFAKHGVELVSCVDPYGQWTTDTHLRLELRRSLDSTPILFYKSDIGKGHLKEDEFARALRWYSIAIQSTDLAVQRRCFSELDACLHRHGISVPLLSLPTTFFCRSWIDADTVFQPCVYVKTN